MIRLRRRRGARGLAVAGLTLGLVVGASGAAIAGSIVHTTDKVDGTETARGVLLPDNQRVTPLGTRHLVTNGRLLASTLSPDGTHLAALTYLHGTGFLTMMDAASGAVTQQVGTGVGADRKIGDGQVGTDAPLYTPDGRTLWIAQGRDLVRFSVAADGTVASPVVVPVAGVGGRSALPAGMALSPDGTRLYVALNGSNTLGVLDTATNTLTRQIPVGNAPRQVVLTGGEAYVTNEGGRPAADGEYTNDSYGTTVVADSSTGAATTGSVSVVDLASGKETGTIRVGLEPTAAYLTGHTLMVANSNSDSVSLIDTTTHRVRQTFNVTPLPGSTVGSNPNAITMTDDHHLLVSIGRDNAIAVYDYRGAGYPVRYAGLLPTDWYPVNVQLDKHTGQVVVTNDKGIGARGAGSTIAEGPGTTPASGHNTYNDTGSVTTFAMPRDNQLGTLTHRVFVDNGWDALLARGTTPRTVAPVAVPARLGEPSTIKHVFLIIKENRTYDQVLGDIGKGDSDPSLAQFGATVTPNQHALANSYGVFDNFYDEGTLSADGHNWLVQADANDYIEHEFGTWARSYPSLGNDALAYQRDGFLWNAARRAGRSVADFGEYAANIDLPASNPPNWADWYADARILEGKADGPLPVPTDKYHSTSDVPSVNAINDPSVPTFDTDIPDQYRVDMWLKSFRASERTGQLANLNLLALPQDHTAGTSGKDPYPTAMVADNDLAVGRVVDTVSHSRFWKDSAVFVLEDDSQNGVDHVDGHRAPLWIASPYARRGVVDSTYYTQINVVKTIEQILGIAPMNQMDRAAEPMTDAFTNRADPRAYTALPNQVPLDLGLKPTSATAGAAAVTHPQPVVPAAERAVYEKWVVWSDAQRTGGSRPEEDMTNPAQLNRLSWYASTGWRRPYPGDTRILAPDEVPGRNRPAQDLN
ncbi:bifunctional YncE family protein/alkaline phosphatase family protein [Actinocatenispora rupis]|uniref:Phosphoesterase n=1 Tax=Actinocatenispora rupis TaxID=519421 RepID=A0A8J3J9D2_9ACTN|nr:bifunctional YncE family protein/alkaline phosphatase family protein [Actinocatenispora rupis]GID12552.1 phosphoesterase [Actinocatenispora rupis]